MTEDLTLEEQCDAAMRFVEDLLDAFELDARVDGQVGEDGDLELTVDGERLGILVGPRAATLYAVEDVTRAVVQRSTAGQSARVRIDVGGYRERRRAALEAFTRELADRARETGREQVLEPMGASDRKVVHDLVAEMDDLTTASEGEEPRRRVVIRRA